MTGRLAQLGAHLRRIPGVIALVFRNPSLRRVMTAYGAFIALEWGTWITIIVYAYNQGGATTAGVVAFVQLIPATLLSPLASVLGDRHRPGRVLALSYLANGVAVLAMAAALTADADPLLVYVLAAVAATMCALIRPPQYALVPTLARTPLELTASNVTTGWVESVVVLVAPALTGLMLGLSGPALALAVLGTFGLIGFVLVLPVPGPPPSGERDEPSAFGEVVAGVRLLRTEREPRTLIVLLGALYVGIGALDVLYAELAIGALQAGDAWAGYLNAAFGAGGTIGIAATVALVGRRRLIPPILAAMGVWAAALVVLAIVPTEATALVLLATAGAAWTTVDVGGRTLLQRAAPGDLVSRVFGMLESVSNAGLALGALLVPALVALGGTTAALVGAGAILPAVLLVIGRRLHEIDRTATVPVVEIGLLRSMPMFAPLAPPAVESIARQLTHLEVAAGEVVIRQGDVGDRWYAVADGVVSVTRDGQEVARLERGAGFGEIALMLDVPRTATVTAHTRCSLVALDKEAFLEAVTGHPRSIEEVTREVDRRHGRGRMEETG
ncbi:MAG: MFS transporter [Gaiella sp.]